MEQLCDGYGPWLHAAQASWRASGVLQGTPGYPMVLQGAPGYSRVPQGTPGCPRVPERACFSASAARWSHIVIASLMSAWASRSGLPAPRVGSSACVVALA
jgi:hypothetical protein